MNTELINRIVQNGKISLGALQVFSYIATNHNLSTNKLKALTGLPKVTLSRHIRSLDQEGFIVINSESRPFTYSLSEEGRKTWEGK